MIFAITALLAGGAVTFAIVRGLGVGDPELSFVVGAVLGTCMAALAHRAAGGAKGMKVKLAVGVALAVGAVMLGISLHLAYSPFAYVEISVPISAIGSFAFPLILFDNMADVVPKRPEA